jgi:hypothetical protein
MLSFVGNKASRLGRNANRLFGNSTHAGAAEGWKAFGMEGSLLEAMGEAAVRLVDPNEKGVLLAAKSQRKGAGG